MAACPKTNPRYADTATMVERPILAIIRKVDKDFDKDRRKEAAYIYGRRIFTVDPLNHGAYVALPYGFSSGFSAGFQTADSAMRLQNGFCARDVPMIDFSNFSDNFSDNFGPGPMEAYEYKGA